MAYSASLAHSASATCVIRGEPRRLSQLGSASFFLPGTKLFRSANRSIAHYRRRVLSVCAKSFDHIPEEFRAENLSELLLQNYQNIPKDLFGLDPAQLMSGNNPSQRLQGSFPKENMSVRGSYASSTMNYPIPYALSTWDGDIYPDDDDENFEVYPPDIPSYFLNSGIVMLNLPIVPEVAELIVAQFLYLDLFTGDNPIYFYINSRGTQEDGEQIGFDSDATAIADVMNFIESDVYTINIGDADGQAAMLLSLGKKGKRAIRSGLCTATLQLPTNYPASGESSYIWILGREMDNETNDYLEFLEQGTGKPKEEIYRDIQSGNYFFEGQEIIDYGLADFILTPKPIRGQDDRRRQQAKD